MLIREVENRLKLKLIHVPHGRRSEFQQLLEEENEEQEDVEGGFMASAQPPDAREAV